MISTLTKVQLVIFALVTVIGGAFVGGRYAQIDRLVVDRSFPVTAQFSDSGGIFAGAQVTYRGIPVGKVGSLDFTDNGVQATLDIENDAPKIPADVVAIVANKSAIGEQFVDLQPRTKSAPYLASGSKISQQNTRIPIDTTTLLVNVNDLVRSVNTDSLRTVVDELGQAFRDSGDDLATILDTSTDFIEEADANIDVTRSLINDSATVLQTQIDKQGQLSTFAKNLALVSDSLVDADPDIRRLLDRGGESARTVRAVVDENADNLQTAVNDLVTANRPIAENVVGLQAIFILYPYLLQGTFTAVEPSPHEGNWDARFGLVITPEPHTCTYVENGGSASGYRERREAEDIEDVPFDPTVDCKVEDNHIARQPSKTQLTKTDLNRSAASDTGALGSEGPAATGEDSWKWMLLGPASR